VAVVLFAISIIFCLRRIRKEERAMFGLFPGEYPVYRAKVRWQLVPGIF
jgi:protein-S-isoprenylcysteine O-methyltransferase Ste14